MKKLIFTVAAVSLYGLASVKAQGFLFINSDGEEKELLSKNGHQILPQKGDWSLGVNATTVLRYIGNAANGETNNNQPSFAVVSKNLPTATIYGKYFIADDLAWRGGLDVFADLDRDRFRVDDDGSNNPDDVVFDIRDIDRFGITASLGLEKRKGKSRVQGIYGADVFVHYTTNNSFNWQYGNAITASNQEPTITGSASNPTGVAQPVLGYRITEADFGDRFEVGARAFAGVEYFFAPKMSLSGEFYWGINYGVNGTTSLTYESFEGSQNRVIETSTFTEGNRDLEIGLENTSATINLFFYF
ncbi:MAG: hypothetical protein AAF789_06335 [Bacteroidota bacterium]